MGVRVLITGGRGQLGSDLARLLPEAQAPGRQELPVDDRAAVREAFERLRPELVFNCAAYNAVDRAEEEPEAARAVNVEGAENVARECARAGARLVHFSTNYVFDGRLESRPYIETDEPNPLSVYAASKREGEQRVLEALPAALIVRGSALFGVEGSAVKGGSFPERIIRRAHAGQPLRVVADQYVNPTYTPDLAAAAVELAGSDRSGVVHVVPEDCCSWWEFAVEALRLAGLGGVQVAKIKTAELGAAAPRPLNGCLASAFLSPLRSWRRALRDYWEAIQTRSAVDTQPI